MNIDYSSAAVGLRGHCNDYNITTEDASAARGVRGARPLDLKEVSGRSVLARQRAGFQRPVNLLAGVTFSGGEREALVP